MTLWELTTNVSASHCSTRSMVRHFIIYHCTDAQQSLAERNMLFDKSEIERERAPVNISLQNDADGGSSKSVCCADNAQQLLRSSLVLTVYARSLNTELARLVTTWITVRRVFCRMMTDCSVTCSRFKSRSNDYDRVGLYSWLIAGLYRVGNELTFRLFFSRPEQGDRKSVV